MNKKKTLLIVLFIIAVVGIAFLLYWFFFRPAPSVIIPPVLPSEEIPGKLPDIAPGEKIPTEQPSGIGLPLVGEELPEVGIPIIPTIPIRPGEIGLGIGEIANGGRTLIKPLAIDKQATSNIFLASNQQGINFYDQDSGQFYQIQSDGSETLLSKKIFHDVQQITWSPNSQRAVLEYPDGFKTVYDFEQEEQVSLPNNWYDFSFSPTSDQLVFKSDSRYPEDKWLSIANYDGTNYNASKVIPSWSPNRQVVAISRTGEPRGTWEQEVLLIGAHQENYKSLIIEGRGLETKWGPKGNILLYSVYSDTTNFNPTLWVSTAAPGIIGQQKMQINLQTWANKCTFNQAGTSLYCAVPQTLADGSGLVPEVNDQIIDDFYRVDLATGNLEFLAESAFTNVDVRQLVVDQQEEHLYFVDQGGSLQMINLK